MGNKTITTKHTEIGYNNNVEIVERALREQFGFGDASGLITTLAQHIWAVICGKWGEDRSWGTVEIKNALACIQHRVNKMNETLELITGK